MLYKSLNLFVSLFILSQACFAIEQYELPAPGNDLIGHMRQISADSGDSLSTVARRYNVGQIELNKANGRLNANSLQSWQQITIPSFYILPPGPRKGIVINISEMRLYYYPDNEDIVLTAPVSIGREGWETPVSKTSIIEKKKDPSWRVPKSIKEFASKNNIELPAVVPAGPDNPLGQYALRLGLGAYLLHGTNDPSTIGKAISSGCIRMYPEDIEHLYYEVPVGTPVRIINSPYKIGHMDGKLYLEAHAPIKYGPYKQFLSNTNYQKLIKRQHASSDINWQLAKQTIKKQDGLPVQISFAGNTNT